MFEKKETKALRELREEITALANEVYNLKEAVNMVELQRAEIVAAAQDLRVLLTEAKMVFENDKFAETVARKILCARIVNHKVLDITEDEDDCTD